MTAERLGARVPKATGVEAAMAKRRTRAIIHLLPRPISPTSENLPQLTLCHLLSLCPQAGIIVSGDRTE